MNRKKKAKLTDRVKRNKTVTEYVEDNQGLVAVAVMASVGSIIMPFAPEASEIIVVGLKCIASGLASMLVTSGTVKYQEFQNEKDEQKLLPSSTRKVEAVIIEDEE